MKLMMKHVISEYNKHGYYTVEFNDMSHAILVKTEKVDEKITNKAIVMLYDYAYNIRNSRDALTVADKLVLKCPEKIERDDIFVIIYASGGKAHHFTSNRIAYLNWSKRTVPNKFITGRFKEEANILKELYKAEQISADVKKASHPDHAQYSILMLLVLIAVNVYAFIRTLNGFDQFGYYASSIMTGEVYRYITYMFCHASIVHLIGNMISLYIFGKVYMRYEGALSFFLVYIVGGILAAVFDSLYCITSSVNISLLTVGASGAIMAIIGAIATECFTHPDFEVRRNTILLVIAAVFIGNNIGAGINVRCHIFGFMFGIILGLLAHILTMYENEERIKSLEKKKNKLTNIRSSYFN